MKRNISIKNFLFILIFLLLTIFYFKYYAPKSQVIRRAGDRVDISGEYFCVECNNDGKTSSVRLFRGEYFTKCKLCKRNNHWILKKKL